MRDEEQRHAELKGKLEDIHLELYRIRESMRSTAMNYVTLIVALIALVGSIVR